MRLIFSVNLPPHCWTPLMTRQPASSSALSNLGEKKPPKKQNSMFFSCFHTGSMTYRVLAQGIKSSPKVHGTVWNCSVIHIRMIRMSTVKYNSSGRI